MVLYLENPENDEVTAGTAIPFTEVSLAEKLQWAAEAGEQERDEWGRRAQARIQERYSWNAVTSQYEELFRSMAHG